MSLEARIIEDMKTAMRNKNKVALEAIRAIKSALLLAKTDGSGKDGLNESEEIALLSKLKKQRQDAATVYREQNRADLAEAEEAQIEVIDNYLPQQLSEEDIKATVEEIIATTGASGMKDMGKVMGMANKKMAGQADGKTIADMVKAALNS